MWWVIWYFSYLSPKCSSFSQFSQCQSTSFSSSVIERDLRWYFLNHIGILTYTILYNLSLGNHSAVNWCIFLCHGQEKNFSSLCLLLTTLFFFTFIFVILKFIILCSFDPTHVHNYRDNIQLHFLCLYFKNQVYKLLCNWYFLYAQNFWNTLNYKRLLNENS